MSSNISLISNKTLYLKQLNNTDVIKPDTKFQIRCDFTKWEINPNFLTVNGEVKLQLIRRNKRETKEINLVNGSGNREDRKLYQSK
jgi:hypothetical protein